MLEKTPKNSKANISPHQNIGSSDIVPTKKLPYSPPTLKIIQLLEIAGGDSNLQEADGNGFIGS